MVSRICRSPVLAKQCNSYTRSSWTSWASRLRTGLRNLHRLRDPRLIFKLDDACIIFESICGQLLPVKRALSHVLLNVARVFGLHRRHWHGSIGLIEYGLVQSEVALSRSRVVLFVLGLCKGADGVKSLSSDVFPLTWTPVISADF